MDVLDEGKLRTQVIDPALNRINSETIPAAQKAIDEVLQLAMTKVSAIGAQLLASAGQEITRGVSSITAVVESLDGWTLDITIPPITIRLSRPK